MGGAGAGSVLAGVLRRDRMANWLPGEAEPYQQSLVNDGHDYASLLGQASSLLSLLTLARRFRRDPRWASLGRAALVTAALSGGLGIYFAVDTARPSNGIVQRVAISAPLAFMAWGASRMIWLESARLRA